MSSAYVSINPATEEVLKVYPEAKGEEVAAALAKAHSTWAEDWRWRPVAERSKLIARVADLVRERLEEISQLITLEMGKLIDQARGEVALSADILSYYANNGEKFLESKKLPDPNAVLVTEPVGVILAVEPWNFPLYQVARVAGPQLVAGNVLLLKHAPSTPQCAEAIEKLFRDAGAPEGVYTNLFSSIPQINWLIDQYEVRGVTLTGSGPAGASVAERAGKRLKKVVLELGGSDPFIVLPDAPLDEAVSIASAGRMMCMGQACVSSKRFIIIGKDRAAKFTEGLKKSMGSLEPGNPTDSKTTVGPLFSERGLRNIVDQVERAKANGANIVLGGSRIKRPGYYMEPTVVTDIGPDNPLYHEESFGPVASVYAVDTEEEALKLANGTTFGLGSSVIGTDIKHAREFANKVEAGMVWINTGPWADPTLPFGGIKNSGFGRELGELGFNEFVNKKLIRTTELK